MCERSNSRNLDVIIKQAESFIRREFSGGITARVTGTVAGSVDVANRMVRGQVVSFFQSFLIIAALMMIVFRSFYVGLAALASVVLPVFVTVGVTAAIGTTLNVTTMMIANIALGIAAGDAIHYVIRYRRELALDGDYEASMYRSLSSTGRTLIYTTSSIGGGFLVMVFGSLVPQVEFGALTALCMLLAVAANLVVTPIIMEWLRPTPRA
jgi:hypothetical protein